MMNATNPIFRGFQEALRIAFKQGGNEVLKEFGPHAGRLLKKGDGSVMKTFNEVSRALKKL